MRLYRDLRHLPAAAKGAAVAIGNFDGLHRGHRAVLSAMQHAANERGLKTGVMTFAPHPRRFFSPESPPMALEPFHIRARRLSALGVELLYAARFNAATAGMSAGQFIEQVLVKQMNVRYLVTGENFVFGKNRSGDAAYLAEAAREFGFSYSAVAPQMYEEGMYASSRIRKLLGEGDLPKAVQMLGRPYEITGRVRYGEGRGRQLGYRTANLIPARLMLPAHGVYAARYAIAEPLRPEERQLDWRPAVAYLGTRPTYGEGEPWLEVHGLGEVPDLYGRRLRVQLLAHLRGDRTFKDEAALQAQIAEDVTQAERWLEAQDA